MSHKEMLKAESEAFLSSLLGKTLHITVPDGRRFVGTFKCTDNECNVILGEAFEYSMPDDATAREAIAEAEVAGKSVTRDMSHRFVGLIVVPGHRIVKMELESRAGNTKTSDLTSKKASALTIRTKS